MKILILFFFMASAASANISDSFKVTDQKKEYDRLLNTRFVLLPHKDTYLLPYVFNPIPHESLYSGYKAIEKNNNGDIYKKEEAEFQVSFLVPIFRKIADSNFDINLAYTHRAFWQVYNSQWSRPFRETNYNPELFVRYLDPTVRTFMGMDFMGADFGYMHQSNGQIQVLSRSWDRIFGRAFLQSRYFTLLVTGWYRIPEARSVDDNVDIYNYMGFGDIEIYRNFGKHVFHYRTPILSHHFSSDLRYSYPWVDRLRWYVSVQSGYGQSMIEYNRPTQRYGIGVALDSLLDAGQKE